MSKIVVVGDDTLKQTSIIDALNVLEGMAIWIKDYKTAYEYVGKIRPNLCIFDYDFNEEDAQEFIETVEAEDVLMMVVTNNPNRPEISNLIYSGVSWVIDKKSDLEQVKAYIWRALRLSNGVKLIKKTKLSKETRMKIKDSVRELNEQFQLAI